MYSPSKPPEGTNPSDTLTSDLWIPQQGENKCLLFQVGGYLLYYPQKANAVSYGPKNLEQKTDPHFTGQETEVQSKEFIIVVVQSLSYVQLFATA